MGSVDKAKEDLETFKKLAGEIAVKDREFKGNMVIGIGSGSTVVYAAKFIADTVHSLKNSGQDLNVICIPSSFQAKQLIVENKLNLGSLDDYPVVDWTIDGADEVDESNNIIKGGGACLTQEKILASCSKKFYVVADHTKAGTKLGTAWKKGIPIEVLSVAYVPVQKRIESILGGKAVLRMAVKKAGPVVTDNGNFILDWLFPDEIFDWKLIETKIKMIPGVVEVGLFLNMADTVYIAMPGGNVKKFKYK